MNLSELKLEVEIETKAIRQTLSDLAETLQEAGTNPLSATQRTAAAAYMAQCYTGVENILKRIIKYCNANLPSGGEWHIALLKAFKEGTGQVPVLIDETLFSKLSDLRRFRHVVLHRYGFSLDGETVLAHGRNAAGVIETFLKAINQYIY